MPKEDFGSNTKSPGGWGGSGRSSAGASGGMGSQKASGGIYDYSTGASSRKGVNSIGNWNTGGVQVGKGNQHAVYGNNGGLIGGTMKARINDIMRRPTQFAGGKGRATQKPGRPQATPGGKGGAQPTSARSRYQRDQPYDPLSSIQAPGGPYDPLSSIRPPTSGVPSQEAGLPPADVVGGIRWAAQQLGMNPQDLATLISYETAGSFDPNKLGPKTQWGQHKGLIQWGEPQAKKYGIDWNNPSTQYQGIVNYMRDVGYKPGMSLENAYAGINAGNVNKINASDANNGGAPGTVADKVRDQMGGHRQNAIKMGF